MFLFLKDRSYEIVKLFINQIAISVFGTAMAFATAGEGRTALLVGTSIFSVLFYLFIIYVMMWEIGAKDSHKIEKKLPGHSPLTGLYMGLISSIPNFVVAGLITLGLKTTVPLFTKIHIFVDVISGFTMKGMYTGLLAIPLNEANTLQINDLWFVYFLIPLPLILTTFLAYFLGSKNFKLFGFKK